MEETKCCKEEKNVNAYMGENDKLISETKMLTQEIKNNILGGNVEEGKLESVLCMFDLQKQQNKNLREIKDMLLEVKNAITAR